MIDSYFFIPGDKPKFLNKIEKINADYLVIDLEDSVSISNKEIALDNLNNLSFDNNIFVRIPFKEKVYNNDQIIWLIKKFNGNIILPKVNANEDLKDFIAIHDSSFPLKIIVLVENPTCFVNIPIIIRENCNHLHGIGFGSHDFCAAIGMRHNLEHLEYYRKQLILYSKAYGINYIDGVDMNIRDLSNFIEECNYAFDAGADGKFIIHPDQLKAMYNIEYFSKQELIEMEGVYYKLANISKKDIDILEVNGKIYEKPHLEKIKKIYSKLEQRKKESSRRMK